MSDSKPSCDKQAAKDHLLAVLVAFLERGSDPRELLGEDYDELCERFLGFLETLGLSVSAEMVRVWIKLKCPRQTRSAAWLSKTDYRE